MALVWHYTDLAGFIGIVTSHRLWASNVLYLNDDTELKHGRQVIGTVLKRLMEENPNSSVLRNINIYISVVNIDFGGIYSVSFCSEPDLLSQWRGYAAGAGVSIGFMLSDEQLTPVMYDEDEQRSAVEAILKKAIDGTEAVSEVLDKLDAITPLLKNASFKEEREYRVVKNVCVKESQEYVKEYRPKVKFRARGGMIVPYVELPYQADDAFRLPIVGVVIGPVANKDVLKMAVMLALEENGYEKLHVLVTDTPYRG